MISLEQVLDSLKEIVAGNIPKNKRVYGLCKNTGIDCLSYSDEAIIKEMFTEWEHYSGEESYPVSSGKGKSYFGVKNKYDKRTTYGKLRFKLAEYLIIEITKHLDGIHKQVEMETAVKKLEKIISKETTSKFGLCMYALNHIGKDFRHYMLRSWVHFSGSIAYPVPDTVKDLSPNDKYNMTDDEAMYDTNTEYGRLRIDLAKHCIIELNKVLNKLEK